MASRPDILRLCRLCLMKDKVNIPIFEDVNDISQIFLKISACLHLKVFRNDGLPKKICDNCSYKLGVFYEFLNTCTASEKQLLAWLNQLNTEKPVSKVVSTLTSSHITNVNPVILKQEVSELLDVPSIDELSPSCDLNLPSEAQEYVLQQQHIPYDPVEFEFQQDEFADGRATNGADGLTTNNAVTIASSYKRGSAVLKVVPNNFGPEDDELTIIASKIAKTETGNGNDNNQMPVVDLPSTSGDNNQPGPSGLGKGDGDAPFRPLTAIITDAQTVYECEVCTETFKSKKDFLAHHMNQFGQTFTCCRCNLVCKTTTELYDHYELHKNNAIILEDHDDSTRFDYNENVETIINLPNQSTNETNELLYILDGSQCVNEIIIEDENEMQEMRASVSSKKSENIRIVHVEHGYMLPSIFKGQLGGKRRYIKKESVVEPCVDLEIENSGTKEDLTKSMYINLPKARPKRRHEVPDFSATSFIVQNPNDEIDFMHYKCLRCEQLFISKFSFFRHIEKGKCFVNSCDVCSASFVKNTEFHKHYIAEHTDRAICNFCFRTFMYEKNVKEHMLRHLDQFRHRCEECNKGFYTVREYRNHYKNRHMGIRHKCDVCGRSFADEYYFKRHIATHEKAIKKDIV